MMLKFKWETEFKNTEIGGIPREWDTRKIKEIGKVITGKTPPTKDRKYWNGAFPFITPSDIPDYDIRYDYKIERFLSDEWFKKAKNLLLPSNTPCFVCIGSTIGKICMTKEPSFTNQQINSVITNSENDALFTFYNLRANQFRIRDEYGGGGAAKDIISKSKFEDIVLPYPSFPPDEQSRIATVLSWFDDLIENKKRQNEILEKTAMAIFKSWFVDFEPFKDQKFVYNEELGRKVPEGWEVKPIGEVVEINDGISYAYKELSEEGDKDAILFITLNNIYEGGGFKPEFTYIHKENFKDRHMIYEGDIVLANKEQTKDGRLLGSAGLVFFPPFYEKDFALFSCNNTKVHVKNKNLLYLVYLELLIFQPEITENFHGGTSVWYLHLKTFKENKFIVIPPKEVLLKFNLLIEPLFRKIILNTKEIMILRKVRDALLSLLVFGKLRVEEI